MLSSSAAFPTLVTVLFKRLKFETPLPLMPCSAPPVIFRLSSVAVDDGHEMNRGVRVEVVPGRKASVISVEIRCAGIGEVHVLQRDVARADEASPTRSGVLNESAGAVCCSSAVDG